MPLTWSDAFEQIAAQPAPLTPAEVCAAHFAVLREVLTERLPPINEEELF